MMDDPTVPSVADVAATDAWLDAVGRGEPPADDFLASELTSWVADLSVGYRPAPTPVSVARRSVRGAVAVAVAAVLFAGAGTAAAVPSSPIHHIIFGTRTQQSPASPDFAPAELALARASGVITPLLRGGVVTAAQRSEATRLITDAASAIAVLPVGTERTKLDAQRAALLRELSALRPVAAVPGGAGGTAAISGQPGSGPSMPGRTGRPARSVPLPSGTARPTPSSDGTDDRPAPSATPAAAATSSGNQDGTAVAQPSDPGGQDAGTGRAAVTSGSGVESG